MKGAKLKKIRLQEEIYEKTNLPCSITVGTSGKVRVFENQDFVKCCMRLLENLCESLSMKLYAYCFMPDHVHFIVAVQGKTSIIDLIAAFKSKSTKESWKFGYEGKIYQRRFYDHFIRKDEGLNNAITYVLNNPVRKNMIEDWKKYAFSKCFL